MKMIPAAEEVILLVDFNELDENDSLLTYSDFSLGPWKPQEGLWARLVDGEGCGCLGRIERISGDDVKVTPDWATWVCDAPEWATWSPPKQVAERTEELRETLRWSREHPDEELPFSEGPATRPVPPLPA